MSGKLLFLTYLEKSWDVGVWGHFYGCRNNTCFSCYEENIPCEGITTLLVKELDFFVRHRTASHTPHRSEPLASTKARVKGVG